MEEYHHQLYRRPQMTGQAREEEEVKADFRLKCLSLSLRSTTLSPIASSIAVGGATQPLLDATLDDGLRRSRRFRVSSNSLWETKRNDV